MCNDPVQKRFQFSISNHVLVCFCLFQQHRDDSRHSTASVASEESENEQSNEVNEQETLAGEN